MLVSSLSLDADVEFFSNREEFLLVLQIRMQGASMRPSGRKNKTKKESIMRVGEVCGKATTSGQFSCSVFGRVQRPVWIDGPASCKLHLQEERLKNGNGNGNERMGPWQDCFRAGYTRRHGINQPAKNGECIFHVVCLF